MAVVALVLLVNSAPLLPSCDFILQLRLEKKHYPYFDNDLDYMDSNLQESIRCLCIACALLSGSYWIITSLLVANDLPASGEYCCIPEYVDCRDVLK